MTVQHMSLFWRILFNFCCQGFHADFVDGILVQRTGLQWHGCLAGRFLRPGEDQKRRPNTVAMHRVPMKLVVAGLISVRCSVNC